MNVNKIYYEELRSFCVDGKWAHRKVGIGASLPGISEDNSRLSNRIDELKVIVRQELDRLEKEVIGNNSDKYQNAKELLINTAENIKREVEIIDSGLPF